MDLGLLDAFTLPFMWRALATLAVLAIAAGVVGLGISFRELEFISDGLVHAVFPGLVIGAIVGGTAGLLRGALGAALLAAVLFTLLAGRGGRGTGKAAAGRGGESAAIAVVLTGLFSLGVVLVSRQIAAPSQSNQGEGSAETNYAAQLQDLLFGHLLTVTDTQFWQIALVALAAVGIMALTVRKQIFRAFDPDGFEAAGFRILPTDLALAVATSLLVVGGVQALGVLMVLALLTVPMAVARLVTRRFWLLIPLAILVPLLAGVLGLWASYAASVGANLSVSPGAAVVLILIAIYVLVIVARGLGAAITRARRDPNARGDAQARAAAAGTVTPPNEAAAEPVRPL